MKTIAKKEYEKPKMMVVECNLTNNILTGSTSIYIDGVDNDLEWGGDLTNGTAY